MHAQLGKIAVNTKTGKTEKVTPNDQCLAPIRRSKPNDRCLAPIRRFGSSG